MSSIFFQLYPPREFNYSIILKTFENYFLSIQRKLISVKIKKRDFLHEYFKENRYYPFCIFIFLQQIWYIDPQRGNALTREFYARDFRRKYCEIQENHTVSSK